MPPQYVGACTAVVSALKNHMSNSGVVEEGMWAIKNLGNSAENKTRLVTAKVLEVLEYIQREHIENARILKESQEVIAMLTAK